MALLTDAELTAAREAATEALGGTAVLQAPGYASDGAGGGTTTYTVSGTVECRMAPYVHGSGEQIDANRLSPDSEYLFTFPAETSVALNSQIVHAGGTFAVTAIRRRTDELTRRVEVREVT